MTFSIDQIAELSAPLDRAKVKSRTQGGSSVSYIEAYHAENEANRIFGFDAWDRETTLDLIGEPRVTQDKYGKDQFRVAYRAKVRITVRTPNGGTVVREGCGFGSGIDKDVDQAHESALKEAESDAEKRALKTFGNPFGQALYDKSQSQVADVAPDTSAAADFAIGVMRTSKSLDELVEFWTKNAKGLRADLNPQDFTRVEKAKDEEKARLSPKSDTAANTPFDEQQREAA